MRETQRLRSSLAIAAAVVTACFGLATTSWAQIGTLGGPTGPSLTAPAITAPDRDDPFAKLDRDYSAMIAGDWLIYPTAFAGVMFDSNPSQSASGGRSSAGIRLVPSILAETTNGISKTTIYGMADGQIYTNQGQANSDTVAARTGLIENYQAMPDLVFNAQGDYTHQRDLFSTFGIDHSVTTLNPTGVGLAPTVNPLAYNQFSGTASAQKTFDRAFVNLSGSVVDIVYDQTSGVTSPSPNGVTTTETAQGGFWITPMIYGYVEGSVDQRNYSTGALSSSGYRTVAGLGSDQIGLFKGEMYGGYQAESYDSSAIGTKGSSVFGGRLYYYPLQELTLSASVDQILGVSLLAPTATLPVGGSTKVTDALVQGTYSLAQEWAASGRFGYIHTDYVDATRIDDAWTVGGTISYSVWQNLGLTLDYQHLQLSSNIPLQGFSRDVVTLGLSYKY